MLNVKDMAEGRGIYLGEACPFCGSVSTIGRGVLYKCGGCGTEWDMTDAARRPLNYNQEPVRVTAPRGVNPDPAPAPGPDRRRVAGISRDRARPAVGAR